MNDSMIFNTVQDVVNFLVGSIEESSLAWSSGGIARLS